VNGISSINGVVTSVTLPDGSEVEIETNEDPEEVSMARSEPVIYKNDTEFTEEQLSEGMKAEMKSLRDFDTFQEVSESEFSPEELSEAMTLRWVHRWKGFVKSRLCIRGFTQQVSDLDETYASTPVIWILIILLLIALSKGWFVMLRDISTAFLHAPLQTDTKILVRPPSEFYAAGIIWLLKKAMYGLRTSPRDWQLHFAEVMRDLGFVRLQSDSCVYRLTSDECYILAYVDDLLIIGSETIVRRTFDLMSKRLLTKMTGTLSDEGSEVTFLGRRLRREGDSILIYSDTHYLDIDFEHFGLTKCKPANTPGSSESCKLPNADEPVSQDEHKFFRSSVGRLQFNGCLRFVRTLPSQ